MKVLQVNCVYKKGSTGKITFDLHNGLLDNGIESVVCYGRGELIREPGVYKTCSEWYSKLNNAISRITGIMYGGCYFSTNHLISIIKKEKPDIVHLQCINGYFVNIYRLINWLKVNHYKTVVTLHAEFMYTGGCGHSIDCEQWSSNAGCGRDKKCPRWRSETRSLFRDRTSTMWAKMKKAFEGFDNILVTSVSPWLMERAKRSSILSDKRHMVVLNGLDTAIFHPYDTKIMREELGLTDKIVVFHATPFFSPVPGHFKGGEYICELARRMPDVSFLIAGRYLEGADIPKNITLLGMISDQTLLAKYYSMSDITVLTSKRETFSMVTAESLCCGTPVVGFLAGGPEHIALKKYSRFCEYGNVNALVSEIRSLYSMHLKIEDDASETYSIQHMIEKYIQCYLDLCKGNVE